MEKWKVLAAALLLTAPSYAAPTVTMPLAATSAEQFADIIDFSTIGVEGDPTYDNTPRLVEALKRRTSSGERLVIYIPSGDWWFLTPLPISANLADFRNVTIMGAPSALTAQLQETNINDITKRRTRLRFKTANEADIFWNHVDPGVLFGEVSLLDFMVMIDDRGSGFSFGDLTDQSPDGGTMRGLRIERVTVSRLKHYQSGDTGDGRPWLINEGGTIGWVLNKNTESFGFRFHKVYDAYIDVGVRGMKYGVIDSHCDRLSGKIRGILVGKLLDSFSVGGQAAVAAHWEELYCEAPYIAGVVLTGRCDDLRVETGYDEATTSSGGTHVDPYKLPNNITWTIAQAASSVALSGFATGYDARHYFEPRSVIRVNPTEAGEPDRLLMVTAVTANTVSFDNAAHSSYIARAITGTGDNGTTSSLTRFMGTGAIVWGDRSGVSMASIGSNEDLTDLPIGFLVPTKTPILWGGNRESPGLDVNDPSTYFQVVASCVGGQFGMQAGVDSFGGGVDSPRHPMVNIAGAGPAYDANIRPAITEAGRQVFKPGRGVTAANNQSLNLTFHWKTDELGKSVATYRPTDSPTGWDLVGLLRPSSPATVTAHVYVESGTPTMTFYGGAGAQDTKVLSAGWQRFSKTLDQTQMNGSLIRVNTSGGEAYIESIVVDQIPAPE